MYILFYTQSRLTCDAGYLLVIHKYILPCDIPLCIKTNHLWRHTCYTWLRSTYILSSQEIYRFSYLFVTPYLVSCQNHPSKPRFPWLTFKKNSYLYFKLCIEFVICSCLYIVAGKLNRFMISY